VCAALRGGERVDLVDDDPLDTAQRLARLAREDQVQRLRCGDEDVRRLLSEVPPLLRGRVARPHPDARLGHRLAAALGRERDAVQRAAQVALDVVHERLERADVEHAQAALRIGRPLLRRESVETPEERRERLAGPGGGADERVVAVRNRRPALALGIGRLTERGPEPVGRGRSEEVQGIGRGSRCGASGHGRRV
jgi:hypothetical protein